MGLLDWLTGWTRAEAEPTGFPMSEPIEPQSGSRVLRASRSARVLLGDLDELLRPLARTESMAAQAWAIAALSQLQDCAVEPLTVHLRSESSEVRRAATVALGVLGHQSAVEPLCQVLRNGEDILDVASAAWALARLPDGRSVDPLLLRLACLASPAGLRLSTNKSLDRFDPHQMFLFLNGNAGAALIAALGALRDPSALPAICVALDDPDTAVAEAAASALVDFGSNSVDPLLEILSSTCSSGRARRLAAQALGHIGDPRTVEPLAGILHNPVAPQDSRWLAAACLGKFHGAAALRALSLALGCDSGRVRISAAGALADVGDHGGIDVLLAGLGSDDTWIRNGAARALGRLRERAALEPLVRMLVGSATGSVAATALGALGDPRAFQGLSAALQSPDRQVRSAAALALGNLSERRAFHPLVAAVADSDYWVRRAAATALGELGDRRAMVSLNAACHDGEHSVRLAALAALARLGDSSTYGPLADILWTSHLEHEIETVAVSLGSLCDARAIGPLLFRLRGSSRQVRKVIWRALERIGWPAVDALRCDLLDARPSVRVAAAEALAAMGQSWDAQSDSARSVRLVRANGRDLEAWSQGSAGAQPAVQGSDVACTWSSREPIRYSGARPRHGTTGLRTAQTTHRNLVSSVVRG